MTPPRAAVPLALLALGAGLAALVVSEDWTLAAAVALIFLVMSLEVWREG